MGERPRCRSRPLTSELRVTLSPGAAALARQADPAGAAPASRSVSRIDAIDGLRGICLVMMTVTHLQLDRAVLVAYLNPRHYGLTNSAHGFFFISGLMVGILGVRQCARSGPRPMLARQLRRTWSIFVWQQGLLALLLAFLVLLPATRVAWAPWLGELANNIWGALVSTLLMLNEPFLLDILPLYVLFMAMTPFLVRLVADGRAGFVIGGSLTLWLLVQLGAEQPVGAALHAMLGRIGVSLELRSYFDPLAWQLVFVAGLVAGGLWSRGELAARLWSPRSVRVFLPGSLLVLAVGFASRLAAFVEHHDGGGDPVAASDPLPHLQLALPYVVHLAAVAYTLAWLLGPGRTSSVRPARQLGRLVDAIATWPPLTLIGRHALWVFSFHVVLCYAWLYVDRTAGPILDPLQSLMTIVCVVSLVLPAMLRERLLVRRRLAAALPVSAGG